MPLRSSLLFLGAFLLINSSCKKEKDPEPEPEPAPAATGTAKIEVNHVAGTEAFAYNKYYINAKGDSVSFTRFLYYISNIVLKAADGSTFAENYSYHLVDHSTPSSMSINLSGIPEKNYTSISFMIGVDSLRNVSGSQTGDLAQSKGMFWTWSSGYIFYKVEGKSPKSGNGLTYHVGGFKGPNAAQRMVTFSLGTPLVVKSGASPVIKLNSDILELFKSPNLVDVSTLNYVTIDGANAKLLADNYADMFTLKSVSN